MTFEEDYAANLCSFRQREIEEAAQARNPGVPKGTIIAGLLKEMIQAEPGICATDLHEALCDDAVQSFINKVLSDLIKSGEIVAGERATRRTPRRFWPAAKQEQAA